MKLAFVFPGQGSQSVGMMQGWGERAEVRATFVEASDALGQDLWALVTDGPADLLNQTINTQPAMLAADVAAWRVWQAAGGATPALLAGHSLGEYAALVAAGSMSFADAIKLVRFRAEAMQAAVPEGVGAMAAILGLDDDAVRAAPVADGPGEAVRVEPRDEVHVRHPGTGGGVSRLVPQAGQGGDEAPAPRDGQPLQHAVAPGQHHGVPADARVVRTRVAEPRLVGEEARDGPAELVAVARVVDAHRIGVHEHEPTAGEDPPELVVEAEQAAARVEEVARVVVRMEADEVRAEQPVEHLAAHLLVGERGAIGTEGERTDAITVSFQARLQARAKSRPSMR